MPSALIRGCTRTAMALCYTLYALMPNVKSTDITETIPCIRDELEWKVRLNAFSDTAHFR